MMFLVVLIAVGAAAFTWTLGHRQGYKLGHHEALKQAEKACQAQADKPRIVSQCNTAVREELLGLAAYFKRESVKP